MFEKKEMEVKHRKERRKNDKRRSWGEGGAKEL